MAHPNTPRDRRPSGARRRARAARDGVGADLLGLLADATTHFFTCPAAGIDAAVRQTLAEIGTFFDVDRAYLFVFSNDLRTADNTHEWCAAGIESQIGQLQGVPTDSLPWWMSQMRAQCHISLPTAQALPAHARAERELMQRQSIRSLLMVPMSWGGRLEGFAGFDHVRGARRWCDNEIAVLKILVNAMAQAFERRRREEVATRLTRLAFHDALTRLPNRALLADRLYSELERSRFEGRPLGIVYLDLDGFKPINDAHGHAAGDRLLAEVARRMVESVRHTDTVARVGGDEFVVLLPDLGGVNDGIERVRRLQRAIAVPVSIAPGLLVAVRASAGLRVAPPGEVDADTLLRQADKAMYSAKQQGLGRVHVYDARRHAEQAPPAPGPAVEVGA